MQCNATNSVKLQLLKDVNEKRKSLKDMYAALDDIKKLSTLRKQVRNYLNVTSFEIARKKFPHILNDEHLRNYLKFELDTLPEQLKVSFRKNHLASLEELRLYWFLQ